MLAYNEAAYIDEAIRSVMLQETDFPFELVIGNDASTDDTLSRCLAWQKRYPDKIVILDNEENLGLAGNYRNTFNHCQGDYLAICEGDDYWIDKKKLQRQVGFLEAHSEYALCFHRVVNYYEDDRSLSLSNRNQKRVVTVKDIALYNPISNVSVCYRKSLMEQMPEFMKKQVNCDLPLHILFARFGDAYYMRRPMALYRKRKDSIWAGKGTEGKSMLSLESRDLLIEYLKDSRPDIVRWLRIANARKCLSLMNYYQNRGMSDEAKAAEARLREYDPQWSGQLLPVSEQGKSWLGGAMSELRRRLSRFVPVPKIKS